MFVCRTAGNGWEHKKCRDSKIGMTANNLLLSGLALRMYLCQHFSSNPSLVKHISSHPLSVSEKIVHVLQCKKESVSWFTKSSGPAWLLTSAFPQTLSLQELQKDFESASPTDTNNNQTTANGASISYITFYPPANGAGQVHTSSELGSTTTLQGSTFRVTSTADVDPMATAPPYVSFHTIILDMSGVCFVDLMGTKALGKVSPLLRTQPGSLPPRYLPLPCAV